MARSYVKFEVSKEVVTKTYEALQLAKQTGAVKKGVNETTKSIERGLASFVVMAGDVEPEEVVMHIPMLCEQKKIPYSYVPSKLDLGKSIGLGVQCAAVAVENKGKGASIIDEIIGKVTGAAPKEAKPKPSSSAAPQPKPAPEAKAEKK